MRSLGANRAVDSAALYGRFREVVSGGNGEGKIKIPGDVDPRGYPQL